jgi:hypothetical protein
MLLQAECRKGHGVSQLGGEEGKIRDLAGKEAFPLQGMQSSKGKGNAQLGKEGLYLGILPPT